MGCILPEAATPGRRQILLFQVNALTLCLWLAAPAETRAKFEMKGGDYQAKQDAAAGGGDGGAQQRRRGGKGGKGAKGGRGGGTKAQLNRLEKKLGWGGFDDKLPPEKVGRAGIALHAATPHLLLLQARPPCTPLENSACLAALNWSRAGHRDLDRHV